MASERDPIVKALHAARLAQGLTQVAVADRAGFPRTTLAMYEGDFTIPPLPRLHAWAGALGFRIALVKDSDSP